MESEEQFFYFDKSQDECIRHLIAFEECMLDEKNKYKCHTINIGTCVGSNILAVLSLHYKLNDTKAVYVQIALDYTKNYKFCNNYVNNLAEKFIDKLYPLIIRKKLESYEHIKWS